MGAECLPALAKVVKKAVNLSLTVDFTVYASRELDLVPEFLPSPRNQVWLEVGVDGTEMWWLEDSEILHRTELVAVTALALLARSQDSDDSVFLAWLQELSGFVPMLDEGVPRCPYCHTRVRTVRTRQCRRCGNAWHEQVEGGPLPPRQAKRKLLHPAERPDVHAALARFPSGACRYPYNLKKTAHPRAKKLLPQAALWDITNENAPFGSDEGSAALEEFQSWRATNPGAPLMEFLRWTVESPSDWKLPLTMHEASEPVVSEWIEQEKAGKFDFHNEVRRRDTNIISSALAQLVYEGRIDADAKPFVMLAVTRQCLPSVLAYNSNTRSRTLMMERIRAAIEGA